MATEFSREFFADNRIVKASLRCAHKLREKDLDRIKSEIKKLYDATEVILNITVDESLLSGYVLQVGDRVFDNSGRHQLDKMMEGKPSLATLKTRIEDYKPAANTAEGGTVVSAADGIVTVEGMDLSDVDRIFLRSMSFDNEGGITVSTVEQEADIRIYDDYMIESAAYILGEAQVYLERNGEEFYVGQVSAPPYSCLSYPASDTYSPGETLTIGGQCFIQGDRVLLYGGNENQDYNYAETTVTADGITFVVPDSGDAGLVIYDVLIERGGVYISLDWNFMAEMDRI